MAIIWNNLLNVLKSKKGLGITFTRSAYDFAAFVDIVSSKIMEKRKIVRSFRKDHGKTKVADITVDQMYRSMTGTETLVYEPSNIDPEKGIRYYNQTISECWERLPKVDGGHQPLPEAALNGLAGPRAGKACEDGCTFLMKMRDQLGENPSEAEMRVYVYDFIKCGHRIPGYGHGILNNVDPRFLCEKEFATKNLPNDPLFKLALTLEKVAHPLLVEIGTVKCPWPNVYALLGLVLNHYGLKETNFYPVIMGVSRCLGIAASSIWSRGMILPIERPKSYSTGSLMKMLGLPK
ncbi:probable citrate synthase 2, mitochondrial [Hermetia illucens]|uniref:probable citrate synthase 2, mitochondrial n=1 Tax=Hermetia illucens TaxID=343691 RepID=UPI0018CBF3B6|nr:probable citrate synthase 2, mitochondrial [Hermetia illucens]